MLTRCVTLVILLGWVCFAAGMCVCDATGQDSGPVAVLEDASDATGESETSGGVFLALDGPASFVASPSDHFEYLRGDSIGRCRPLSAARVTATRGPPTLH